MSYYTGNAYDEIDLIVYGILIDYEVSSFPIDIKELAVKMGFELIPFSSLSKEKYKELIRNSKTGTGFHICDKRDKFPKFFIYYNDIDWQEGRQRITIGHEIKHIVCCDGSEPTAKQENLGDYFGKQLNAPRAYLVYKNIIETDEIMSETGLGLEAATYLSASLKKRVSKHGNKFFGSELAYIDFLKNGGNHKTE